MIPGFLQHGDVLDVARLADAAFLISGTTDDVWSENAQELYDGLIQSSKDAELRIYKDTHRFRDDMRAYAYDFLDRKLKG